jgi:anti-sigma factor ChrR (cupin superfamily)
MQGRILIADALKAAAAPDALKWEPFRDDVEVSWIYKPEGNGAGAAFLRYPPGARVPYHRHAGYEHILVISGAQSDEYGHYPAGTLVINPPGTAHRVVSEEGCVVLIVWERPVEILAAG